MTLAHIDDKDEDDYWTTEELAAMPLGALRGIALEQGTHIPRNATKAVVVALLMDESISSIEIPLTPEEMLREAIQLRSWVRGIPPADACLTAADKFLIQRLSQALDPVWAIPV